MKIIDFFMKKLFHVSISEKQETLKIAKKMATLTNGFQQQQAASRQQKALMNNNIELQFKKTFESDRIAMSFYDKDGYLIELNNCMRQLCGFDAEGEKFFRETRIFDVPVFHDLDPSRHDSFYTCQHMFYPELGINKYIEVRVQPTFDATNKLRYYTITTRDVTEKRRRVMEQSKQEDELKETSEAISRYEQELNYLLKHSNMYVWSLDMVQKQITFTRSLKKPDYILSFDQYLDSLYEDHRQASIEHMKELLSDPKPFNDLYHFKYTPNSQTPRWHTIDGIPIVNDEGQVTSIFGLLRDVTDMMDIQQQLQQEQTRAKASGVMKSAFLANMSHEIRTPLNAIVGFSDLLQVIDEPSERQEFIRIIRNNSDMLLRLINDILEASDMGQALAIEPADVDFSQVFNDICQTLEQRVEEPGIEFIKENPYPTYLTTLDKGRVQQVITNFVTNAVKFTHEGHIKVGYREQDGGLYIYCEDTGVGIPKDKQANVFDRFVKLNDNVMGTGLGLSICKNIIERCGGSIGVDSEGKGHGCTFWFWIPCEKKEETTTASMP
ncbi:MAG: PAS domain-containing sensor histidine kinase [Prevotella sp.]|nr:PAS domain-containing sensor histidine kinase [Prevotella sp.]